LNHTATSEFIKQAKVGFVGLKFKTCCQHTGKSSEA